MGIRLDDDGIAEVVGDDVLARLDWSAIDEVSAMSVDHMTQRIATLTFTGGCEVIEVSEGQPGWDETIAQLGGRLVLTVPDLLATVSMLRTDEEVVVFTTDD